MSYSCKKCGRAFDCEERISFCPFCGAAYAAAAALGMPPTTRIVIGSDSERTVQEQYWRMAHRTILGTLVLLEKRIPDDWEYEREQLDLETWQHEQKKCSSVAQFKWECETLLHKIENCCVRRGKKERANPSTFRRSPKNSRRLAIVWRMR